MNAADIGKYPKLKGKKMTGWPGHYEADASSPDGKEWVDGFRAKQDFQRTGVVYNQLTVFPMSAKEMIDRTTYSAAICWPTEVAQEREKICADRGRRRKICPFGPGMPAAGR